jgi:ribonuclease P protein component
MDFPKSARVLNRAEYLKFFEGSDIKRLGVCTLFRVANTKGVPRLGMTIKARVNSVYRNKLKRQIREAFRHGRSGLKAHDYNVVVPGGVSVNHKTPKLVRKQLDSVWLHENRF